MTRFPRSGRIALAAALTLVLVLAIAALAGAAPPPGKGKPSDPGKPAAVAAKKQNGPSARQYGQPKVTLCHKGKTIRVAEPARRAHLRHGDTAGPCPQ
jgi:hypothetical protein